MDQLTFKFPFSKKYFEQDYFISSNNFSAFKFTGNRINIKNAEQDFCFDVAGTSGSSKKDVQLWSCLGNTDQYWFIDDFRVE